MIRGWVRRFAPAFFVFAAATSAGSQTLPPPPAAAPNANPTCVRLEGFLANLDRTSGEAARAEQVRRFEEAAQRQQQELDRIAAQAQRMGCTGSGFFLFGGGQPPQCDRLNNQMQSMRANLDRINVGQQQLEGNRVGSDIQRRQVLAQLAQNNCGPQYRVAAAPPPQGGIFGTLFGNNGNNGDSGNEGNPNPADANAAPPAGTFRTVCVRTCDGFYFPISYATVPGRFADDERICQRMCPAAEVKLYSYRNPGEDMAQAVASDGRRYSELPTAFRYRQEFNAACSCRQVGQSWADALKNLDDPVERGDIVVTPDKAKLLSQPQTNPAAKTTKQKSNVKTDPKAKDAAAPPPADTAPPPPAPVADTPPPDGKKTVRIVGPQQLVPGH
jgi:Protein of unknown function (DUF2865)